MGSLSVNSGKSFASVRDRPPTPAATERLDTLAPTTSAPRAMPSVARPEPSAPLRAMNAAMVRPVMALGGSFIEFFLRRHGFTSTMVPTPDGPVHLWDAQGMNPEGPTVVFFHGIGTFASEYAPVLKRLLQTSARVIAVDLPGAGRSFDFMPEPEDGGIHQYREIAVRAVCHAVAQKTTVPLAVLGHSLGGYFAARLSLDADVGPRVEQLILVSPDGAPWSKAALEDMRLAMHVRHYRDALATARRNWENKPVLSHVMAPFIWARFAESKVLDMVDSDMCEPVLEPEEIAALPARTLLVVGAQEREYETAGRLAYFESHLPAEYALARPNMAHGDMTDAPASVMDLICDYAAGKDVGTQPHKPVLPARLQVRESSA